MGGTAQPYTINLIHVHCGGWVERVFLAIGGPRDFSIPSFEKFQIVSNVVGKTCLNHVHPDYFPTTSLRGNSSSSVFQSRVLIFTCWSFSYIHTSRYRFFRWIPFARGYLVLVIKFSFGWKYATWEERDVSSDVRKETVRYILYESSLKLYDWLILRSFNSKSEDLVSNRMNVLFRVIFLHIFLRRIVSWWRTSQVTSQVISLHGWRKDIALTICRSTD